MLHAALSASIHIYVSLLLSLLIGCDESAFATSRFVGDRLFLNTIGEWDFFPLIFTLNRILDVDNT